MGQHVALPRVCKWPQGQAGLASAAEDAHREPGLAGSETPGAFGSCGGPSWSRGVPGIVMHRTPAESLGAEAQLSDLHASQKLSL